MRRMTERYVVSVCMASHDIVTPFRFCFLFVCVSIHVLCSMLTKKDTNAR